MRIRCSAFGPNCSATSGAMPTTTGSLAGRSTSPSSWPAHASGGAPHDRDRTLCISGPALAGDLRSRYSGPDRGRDRAAGTQARSGSVDAQPEGRRGGAGGPPRRAFRRRVRRSGDAYASPGHGKSTVGLRGERGRLRRVARRRLDHRSRQSDCDTTGADQVVIPTTYAGSEMTDILGETAGGEKTTRRDPSILPETVIYDVGLTRSLPPSLTVTSGLNAMAHAAEALYAADRNPIVSLMAADAIRALCLALPAIARNPDDRDARASALYGAWLCGAALGGTSMALHHKLCHVLGGSFDTPHAETHAILLPHTIGFNSVKAADLLARSRRSWAER